MAASPLIPRAPLIAAGAFGSELAPALVASAIARGLRAGGVSGTDVCALDGARLRGGALRASLAALDFDARMQRSRAVILAERRLDERTLEGSAAFEIASRARQSGVPAYAVTAHNELDSFDARVLDLQLIITAASARALAAAGRELALVL
ncbi:MAG TPA: glycerate kinase [Solirubrobacteraceae bacterium]|nr:glycerate kinase [Solirubrobacteraceae bacterium]